MDGFVRRNNVTQKTDGIARSLFDSAAHGGLSVAVEESVGDGGAIDEALSRLHNQIARYEGEVRDIERRLNGILERFLLVRSSM